MLAIASTEQFQEHVSVYRRIATDGPQKQKGHDDDDITTINQGRREVHQQISLARGVTYKEQVCTVCTIRMHPRSIEEARSRSPPESLRPSRTQGDRPVSVPPPSLPPFQFPPDLPSRRRRCRRRRRRRPSFSEDLDVSLSLFFAPKGNK